MQTGVTDPYFTGFVVFAVTTGLCGIANVMDYLKKKKTGKEAISDTFKESAKVGVCSVIGITAGNGIAGTGLVLIAPSVLPITAGITATFLLKRFWDKTISAPKDAATVAPSAIS
jgi:multisubunit Na+/H+ antiporter MnhB subunit